MTQSISLNQVYEEIKRIESNMVTKKELLSLVDTIEILNNPETMDQISQSTEDIKQGKVKKIGSARDLLSEL